MFNATLLVITMSGGVILKDTQGPYQTQAECRARLSEIAKEVPGLLGKMLPIGTKGVCAKAEPDPNSLPMSTDPIG